MEINLTTPALLFPAISLLLLAYTSRFLALAALMRELYSRYKTQPDPRIKGQIASLRYRIGMIRNMQVFGVASFVGLMTLGKWIFAGSLLLLLISLGLSLREVQVSIDALTLQMHDLD